MTKKLECGHSVTSLVTVGDVELCVECIALERDNALAEVERQAKALEVARRCKSAADAEMRSAHTERDKALGEIEKLRIKILDAEALAEGEKAHSRLQIKESETRSDTRADGLIASLANVLDQRDKALAEVKDIREHRDASVRAWGKAVDERDALATKLVMVANRLSGLQAFEGHGEVPNHYDSDDVDAIEAAVAVTTPAEALRARDERVRAEERESCAAFLGDVCSLWQAAQALRERDKAWAEVKDIREHRDAAVRSRKRLDERLVCAEDELNVALRVEVESHTDTKAERDDAVSSANAANRRLAGAREDIKRLKADLDASVAKLRWFL